MKKHYDGLTVYKIPVNNGDFIATSNNCIAMIQLELQNGVCISDEWQQQITYVGDQG